MKLIIVGADAEGRSCVASEKHIELAAANEMLGQELWSTVDLPPTVETSRRSHNQAAVATFVDKPGSQFLHAALPAGYVTKMHRTDTLDYCVVMSGAGTLMLEADEIELQTGDCFVNPGLPHHTRAGSDGITLGCTLLGLEPPLEQELTDPPGRDS